MMDFIALPVITGIIVLGIYKLFELYARRRERIMLIEKLDPSQITGFDAGKLQMPTSLPTPGTLSIGCLLAGLGLGLLVGYFICTCSISYNGDVDMSFRWFREAIYGGSILLFGGAGLIVSFVIGQKLAKKKE